MSTRTEQDEKLTRFGYYARLAARNIPEPVCDTLAAHGYDDPRDVMQELSDWLYAQRQQPS